MSTIPSTNIFTIGLAVFSMLFGAGNIIYPIKAGVDCGSLNYIGIIGFLLTGALLPLIGLYATILFEGNYESFFARIGNKAGKIAIFYCMLVIGPFLAMPRCITVPYSMISFAFPNLSLLTFSILFGILCFLLTYKKSKILDLLGNIISPLLLTSLAIILIKGLFYANTELVSNNPNSILTVFFSQLIHGFQTLDMLGGIFFAYIVIRLLKSSKDATINFKALAYKSLQGGLIGSCCIGLVYIGFSYIGAYYSHLIQQNMNGAEIFHTITLHIIHDYGVLVVIVAVLMACISTITVLAAILAEYVRSLSKKKISYHASLLSVIIVTVFISNFGLSNILYYGAIPINIGYPIIITIVFCNIAYKLWGFPYIKVPAFLAGIISSGWYLSSLW